jgi:hypothetical protein
VCPISQAIANAFGKRRESRSQGHVSRPCPRTLSSGRRVCGTGARQCDISGTDSLPRMTSGSVSPSELAQGRSRRSFPRNARTADGLGHRNCQPTSGAARRGDPLSPHIHGSRKRRRGSRTRSVKTMYITSDGPEAAPRRWHERVNTASFSPDRAARPAAEGRHRCRVLRGDSGVGGFGRALARLRGGGSSRRPPAELIRPGAERRGIGHTDGDTPAAGGTACNPGECPPGRRRAGRRRGDHKNGTQEQDAKGQHDYGHGSPCKDRAPAATAMRAGDDKLASGHRSEWQLGVRT